jgi:hypothetical protein
MAISFGTTVGAISLPEFSNIFRAGSTFTTVATGAGGGGGGGGGAARNVDVNCRKSSVSVKYSPAKIGARRINALSDRLISVSTSRELLFIRLYSSMED